MPSFSPLLQRQLADHMPSLTFFLSLTSRKTKKNRRSFQFTLVFYANSFRNFHEFSFSNSKKMYLKVALFSSSSLKHIRWRFRTCVSCRVSVKRYVQNKILRRCASMYNKWYYTLSSSFEILHHLLPSIFVLTFFVKGVAPDLNLSLAWYSGFSCVFHRFSVCFSPLRQSQPADHMPSFAWYSGFSCVFHRFSVCFSPLV